MHKPAGSRGPQTLIGVGVMGVAAVLAWGAVDIPSEAGYAGVGPDFLPWVTAAALALLGAWLVFQALTGGFRQLDAPSGAARGDWPAAAWVVAGIVANAALLERIGFVLACALCFALAVRGFRVGEGKPAGNARQAAVDAGTGLLIAAPVFWLFTKVLGVNLPGITGTGWL